MRLACIATTDKFHHDSLHMNLQSFLGGNGLGTVRLRNERFYWKLFKDILWDGCLRIVWYESAI